MSAAFTLEPQAPYGALVQATAPDQQLDVFDAAQIQGWVAQHRFVVFRGFDLFDKPHFARFAQQLGEPYSGRLAPSTS